MSSIFDLLGQHLGDDTVAQISEQVGTSRSATRTVVEGAVPMLVSALARNANSADGAAALLGALTRDHDGSIFDNLGSLLGGSGSALGDGILGHVLGGKRGAVEDALSRSSGLSMGQVAQILAMLAPLVMGALGKMQRGNNLDTGGLSDLLRGEKRRVEEQAPDAAGLFEKILDRDGDGSMMDDLASTGMSILGGLLGGRR